MDESLNKDFLDAVNTGRASLVRELMSKGANIEIRDDQGKTPLLIAASKGHLEVVQVLIEVGCDLKAKDHHKQNALHKAILGNSKNIVCVLLDTKTVEYDLKDDQGKSPLDYAKEGWSDPKHIDTLEKIFDVKCQNLLQTEDFEALLSDQDLVIYLIKSGSPQIFDLMNKGLEINVNATGSCYTQSPLYYAFRAGHKDLFKKLIDLGANTGSLGLENHLPVNYSYPFLKADCDMLSILIQGGFNINSQDAQGRSALYIALEYSQKETAEALIKLGCDVNLPDKDTRYPLHKVMQAILDPVDRISLINLLLENGADVKVKDKEGKNPLHKALEVFHSSPDEKVDIVHKFLENGIDINERDRYGQTAFGKALYVYLNTEKSCRKENDLDDLHALFINGADINIPDNKGCIPLHYGASSGRDMVKLLTKYGNKVDTLDKSNETPADKAVANFIASRFKESLDISGLEELLDKGATFTMKEEFSRDPKSLLYYAIKKGAILTALYLIKNDLDLHEENYDKDKLLSLAIDHDNDRVAFALLDKDKSLRVPDLLDEKNSPLNKAITKKNLKLIHKLLDLGAGVTPKHFNRIITKDIDKTDHVGFMSIMIKLLDPKTNVVSKNQLVYQAALRQVSQAVDKFKKEEKGYSQLEDLRDIIKSLKSILNNPDDCVFSDKKEEEKLLKLCHDLLPHIENEYSSLSEDHFEYLLSKSDPVSFNEHQLEKTPDKAIKRILEHLPNEGGQILTFSKAGVYIVDQIQNYLIQKHDSIPHDSTPDVQEAGASIESEDEIPV